MTTRRTPEFYPECYFACLARQLIILRPVGLSSHPIFSRKAEKSARTPTSGHAQSGGTLVIGRLAPHGDILCDDQGLAFLHLTISHFSIHPIRDADFDFARLRFVIWAEEPDQSPLP